MAGLLGFKELVESNTGLPESKSKSSGCFYSWIFDKFKFYNFALDIGPSVTTRYGVQEGAKKGYNPTKTGRVSHHPLIAFMPPK